MEIKKIIILSTLVFPLTLSASIHNQKIFDVGISSGFYQYKEPSVNERDSEVTLKGMSYAVHGGVQYTFDNRLYLAVKGMYEFAPKLSYKCSNPIYPASDSEKSYIFDVSPRLGYSFIYDNDIQLSVYVGYGYEHLKNKGVTGITTVIRWQEYHYGLIGANFIKHLGHNWLIDASLDLNYMFHGKNKTNAEYDDGVGNTSVSFKQKDGLGIRADLMTGQDYEYWGWRVGLYFRGWDIGQSSVSHGSVEPKNTTYDTGVKLKITF